NLESCFTYVYILNYNIIDAQVEKNVLLPCIFTGPPPKQINVFWRDRDAKAVLNIKNGSPVSSDQNQRYQDRVFSFQEEFINGNFSIQMKNLQISDSDTYVCNIVPGHKRRVQLRVSGEMKMMFLHRLWRTLKKTRTVSLLPHLHRSVFVFQK
uniref:Ig-like domain-containing protein n=1 Tax=Oryzias latipes TaxID=8090 RepID=A0A3P9HRX0_ORYLA